MPVYTREPGRPLPSEALQPAAAWLGPSLLNFTPKPAAWGKKRRHRVQGYSAAGLQVRVQGVRGIIRSYMGSCSLVGRRIIAPPSCSKKSPGPPSAKVHTEARPGTMTAAPLGLRGLGGKGRGALGRKGCRARVSGSLGA